MAEKTQLTPDEQTAVQIGEDKYGFHDDSAPTFSTGGGLTEDIVRKISEQKAEPGWMRDYRVKAYRHFVERPMPRWGANLETIDFDNIYYYMKPVDEQAKSWDDLPPGMRET